MLAPTPDGRFKRILLQGSGNALRARLVRGTMGVGGLKLLSVLLTLAVSVVLARGLGPKSYGQYAFVMAVISVLALPVGPGLAHLITREVSRYHHGEEWGLYRGLLRRAYQFVGVGSGMMLLAIVVVAMTQVAWSLDDRWTLLLIASPMLPLLGLNTLRGSTLQGLRNVIYAQLPELVVRPSLLLLLAGGLLVAGVLNIVTALVCQIIGACGAFLLGTWFLQRLRPGAVSTVSPAYREREWGRTLLPFMLLAAVGTLNGQVGILALGWLGTNAEVAALRVAESGAMVVAMSLSIVNAVIAPHITRIHRDNNRVLLQQLSRQSARAALAVALPLALPLIILGEPIIRLVYGEVYADCATWPLVILAAAQLVNVAFGSVGLFLTMSGYERDTLIGQAIALLVNVVVATILVPPLGAMGAALAIATGLVTWNGVLAIRLVRQLGFRPSAF